MNKKQLRAHKHLHDDVRAARREGIPARVAAIRDADEDIGTNPTTPDPVGHTRDRVQLLQRLRQLHAAYSQKRHSKMVTRSTEYKAKREQATNDAMARRKVARKDFFSRHGGRPNNKSNARGK